MKSNFFFEVFKIALLIQRHLRHIFEKSPYLNTAKLNGNIEIQRLKVLLEVIITNLERIEI